MEDKERVDRIGGVASRRPQGNNEALFRSVFDNSPSGIVVFGRDGKIVRANQAFCRLLRYSEAELKELTILELTHPEDREEIAQQLTAERRGVRAALDVEKRYLRKDGRVIWGHVTASTVIGTAGQPFLTFAIVRDISARRRAEEETRRRSQFIEQLVDAAQAIILVMDTEGRIVQFNHYMEELSGCDLETFRGQDWFENFSPPAEREHQRSLFRENVEGKSFSHTVNTIVSRDGGTRLIQWSSDMLKGPKGKVSGILSIGIDITEQERAEREVLAEKERSRAILATALDGIVTISELGIIESFNPSAERMFGYAQREIVGKSVRFLMPPPYREQYEQSVAELLTSETGESRGFVRELEACRRDGTVFPIHLSLTEMHVGGRRSYCGFIRDLTETRAVEEQLRQAQKMEAIGSLASGVAHDFNNLLMGVSGCASVAQDCVDAGQSDRMYLAEIKKAAESGTAMTRQLLAFSRKAEVELVIFELDEAITAQEGLLRRLLGEDIELTSKLGAGDCLIRADVGQVDQILMNLAVNARDAMSHGGRLRIETKAIDLPVARRWDSEPGVELPAGRYVQLSVADDGCGMSPETRKRLFEPFYTTKEVGRGTGLGLAMVYGIVKQAHGHIEVKSAEGEGTRFEILLPQSAGERTSKQRFSQQLSARPCHGTILLCEDDRLVRLAIRYYLEGAGYRVLRAQSGAEAIECCMAFASSIDLLLTDIVLPDQSGDRVASEIRLQRPEMKVLYMSAHTPEWLRTEGRIEHELETLQKPFDREFLLARVGALLEGTGAAAAEGAAAEGTGAAAAEGAAAEGTGAAAAEGAGAVLMGRTEANTDKPHGWPQGAVLIAEDDDAVRLSLCESFRDLGYEVLSASDGAEALAMARDHDGAICALVVDVVLPSLMGVAVARGIEADRPGLCVIYLSGYPREVAIQEELVGSARFAQKPVRAELLHEMIQLATASPKELSGGSIVVVEDSSAARLAITEFLAGEGWEVLSAANGADALRLLRARGKRVDVLLVDYSLPDMKGDALAAEIRELQPNIVVAYMSGYPGLQLQPSGLLLEKPLELETLSATIQELTNRTAPA